MTDPKSSVRIVRIDQPHARNAVNSATAQRLHDEFVAFNADDTIKVAVLTGDETAFCAGARTCATFRRCGRRAHSVRRVCNCRSR